MELLDTLVSPATFMCEYSSNLNERLLIDGVNRFLSTKIKFHKRTKEIKFGANPHRILWINVVYDYDDAPSWNIYSMTLKSIKGAVSAKVDIFLHIWCLCLQWLYNKIIIIHILDAIDIDSNNTFFIKM